MAGEGHSPWSDNTIKKMHEGWLVNCGGIHCYRLMHPYVLACCGACEHSRQQGQPAGKHSEGCDAHQVGRQA